MSWDQFLIIYYKIYAFMAHRYVFEVGDTGENQVGHEWDEIG